MGDREPPDGVADRLEVGAGELEELGRRLEEPLEDAAAHPVAPRRQHDHLHASIGGDRASLGEPALLQPVDDERRVRGVAEPLLRELTHRAPTLGIERHQRADVVGGEAGLAHHALPVPDRVEEEASERPPASPARSCFEEVDRATAPS